MLNFTKSYSYMDVGSPIDVFVPYVNTQSLRFNDKCSIKLCKPRNCPSIFEKNSLYIFKTQLKTYLFRLAYPNS